MNKVFVKTGNSIHGLSFYTWSKQITRDFLGIGEELSSFKTKVISTDSNEPYGLSYCVDKEVILSSRIDKVANDIANALIALNPSKGIMMFDNMLTEKLTTNSLHNLFSILSQIINEKRKFVNSTALHSPIKSEPYDKGFPVHADLFKSRALLNIILPTSAYKGGDILLISFEDFVNAMNEVSSIPKVVCELIKNILSRKTPCDHFDVIFDLIYGDHHWVDNLKLAIESRQLLIPCSYGAGYFIVDGQWLHGRTKIDGPVLENRLERLVFDTDFTMSMKKTYIPNGFERLKYQSQQKSIVTYKAKMSLPNKSLHF